VGWGASVVSINHKREVRAELPFYRLPVLSYNKPDSPRAHPPHIIHTRTSRTSTCSFSHIKNRFTSGRQKKHKIICHTHSSYQVSHQPTSSSIPHSPHLQISSSTPSRSFDKATSHQTSAFQPVPPPQKKKNPELPDPLIWYVFLSLFVSLHELQSNRTRLFSMFVHTHNNSDKMQNHRRGPWSANEDNYLVSLVKTHGAHNWVRISALIGSRTPKQCRERFHQNLKPSLNHDPITPEEGAIIERLVGEMGKRWAEIARRLQGRSDNAVKNWWNGGMNRRRRLVVRRRADSETGRELRVFVNQGAEDTPMVSPTYSSYSSYSRGQTPSLLSDSSSNFSTSPRSPPSPGYENGCTLPPLRGQYGSRPQIYEERYTHQHTSYLEREEMKLSPIISCVEEQRGDKMSLGFLLS
jgi:Myb-like DNA-binding protein FlbD